MERSSISTAAPAFLMPIEDAFQSTGKGLFVVGQIVIGIALSEMQLILFSIMEVKSGLQ